MNLKTDQKKSYVVFSDITCVVFPHQFSEINRVSNNSIQFQTHLESVSDPTSYRTVWQDYPDSRQQSHMGFPGYSHFYPADYKFRGSQHPPSSLMIHWNDSWNSGKCHTYCYRFMMKDITQNNKLEKIHRAGMGVGGWNEELPCPLQAHHHLPSTWVCSGTCKFIRSYYSRVVITQSPVCPSSLEVVGVVGLKVFTH